MISLSVNNLSFSFGMKTILQNVNINIQDTDKVGLVGVNGAGKTTLFKLLTNQLTPDEGEIFISSSAKLCYLKQISNLNPSSTLWEEIISDFSELLDMENKLKSLEKLISEEKDQVILSKLVDKYSNLSDKFNLLGGYEYKSRAKGILIGLGFSEKDFDLKIQNLSGGQKTRFSLAKLLNFQPDILLLDEPTNHLDIKSIEWLEKFIKNYNKCIILISHDRYFLDQTVNKIIELENTCSHVYTGNYTSFLSQKEFIRNSQQKQYDLQQKEIARMESFIEQQKRWNREKNIIAAESRQKAIDRLKKVDKPTELPEQINFRFKTLKSSGNDVLCVDDISMSFPSKELFRNISFNIYKKERVFLLGENGIGKSTLLKILMGHLSQTSGSIKLGHNVNMDYYAQELETLDVNNTIYDEILNSTNKLSETDIRSALAMFLFKGDDVFKKISLLSGGEKSRLSLIKLMLNGANFLILDEPTNHLDINSREILERALLDYDGTLLIVSHDRYFINKLATRIIELTPNSVLDVSGNYSFFIDYKSKFVNSPKIIDKTTNISNSKLEHIKSKKEQATERRLKKLLQDTENRIALLEEKIQNISLQMLDEDICCDHIKLENFSVEQSKLKNELDELYTTWEEISSSLD